MRRGARNVLGASAALLCLGGLLAASGGESGDGHVATGAAGPAPAKAPGKAGGPTGDVRLIPLDGADRDSGDERDNEDGGDHGDSSGTKGSGGASTDTRGDSATTPPPGPDEGAPGSSGAGGTEGKPPTADGSSPSGTGGATGPGGSASPPPAGTPPGSSPSPPGAERPGPAEPPSGPAALSVGTPERNPADNTDKRWCEKVTVTFRNTGDSPVRSGTVTFGTHIIGALGIDWATIESTEKLPAPIEAGRKKTETWPICVAAWRVPLGMHIETRDVSVEWK
ncbi:hypothetical protein ACOBQB_28000 [Streptomyces sp. G5(2025)]|uniref:hypothetical protein n=1 Tax=Streptomyces sp. G5(2025) TaxID=3406628 RepID=UPI003C26CF8B